jgi:hypothetical protein
MASSSELARPPVDIATADERTCVGSPAASCSCGRAPSVKQWPTSLSSSPHLPASSSSSPLRPAQAAQIRRRRTRSCPTPVPVVDLRWSMVLEHGGGGLRAGGGLTSSASLSFPVAALLRPPSSPSPLLRRGGGDPEAPGGDPSGCGGGRVWRRGGDLQRGRSRRSPAVAPVEGASPLSGGRRGGTVGARDPRRVGLSSSTPRALGFQFLRLNGSMASDLQAPGAAKETPKTYSSLLCRPFPVPSADSLNPPPPNTATRMQAWP